MRLRRRRCRHAAPSSVAAAPVAAAAAAAAPAAPGLAVAVRLAARMRREAAFAARLVARRGSPAARRSRHVAVDARRIVLAACAAANARSPRLAALARRAAATPPAPAATAASRSPDGCGCAPSPPSRGSSSAFLDACSSPCGLWLSSAASSFVLVDESGSSSSMSCGGAAASACAAIALACSSVITCSPRSMVKPGWPPIVASEVTAIEMRKRSSSATQMRALVVEHVERDLRARAHDLIVRRALEQRLLERAQQLQRDRGHRAHVAGAAAVRAFLGRALQHRGADALARHFEQAEMRDAADLDARAVVAQRVLHAPLDGAVVALLVHVDEVDDDQARRGRAAGAAARLLRPPRSWS